MITRDKKFYTNFFKLFFVLVLQNIIVLMVNLIDNIMLGGYSETSLSAASVVNQIQFILQQVIMGVGDGLVVLASQYWGQNNKKAICKLSSIAMKVGILFALFLFFVVSIFPSHVLSLFTSKEAVIIEGIKYLNIIRFTYLIFAITNILLATLRSVETVRIAFFISLSTLMINCGINYILIYGRFGAPRMGIRGAAIGTLTARCVELFIVILYLIFQDKKLRLRFKNYLQTDTILLKDYIKVSLPIIIVAGLWGLSTALQTVIFGHMTSNALAANSIASNLFLILKVASVGASSCAAIIIGKTVGSGQLEKIKEYAKTLQIMFVCIGILTSISLFFLRIPVLNLYKELTSETLELANRFLLVLCVTCIGTAYQMPVLTGIVRGGGDTKFVMINDLISIWGIVLPMSFLAAFVFHWSEVAVICCLNADQIFKCVAAFIRVNGYKWIKRLTRE